MESLTPHTAPMLSTQFARVVLLSMLAVGFVANASAQENMPRRGPWGEAGSTLAMARRMDAESLADLQNIGAVVEETSDRRSFVVWRASEHFDPSTGIVLVTLHGHQGWASRDTVVWDDEIRSRGWAQLAVQWWYGRSAEEHGCARPDDIYRWMVEALRDHRVDPGRVVFQGFSMGSAVSYAVTFLDRQAATSYSRRPFQTQARWRKIIRPIGVFSVETRGRIRFPRHIGFCTVRNTTRSSERPAAGWSGARNRLSGSAARSICSSAILEARTADSCSRPFEQKR